MDFSGLQLNNNDPVYVQIAAYIKRKILLGHVQSGDSLPSRREVAALLNINPNTAQKAYKLMEDEGFVVTNGNQGSTLYIDEQIRLRIENELTREMVIEFIASAKGINLTFKRVFDLISELWEE